METPLTPNEANLVLVTGATGAIGPQVVQALRAAGYRIRTLSLDELPTGVCRDGIDAQIGDVTDQTTIRCVVREVDSVIHMAALLHVVNPTQAQREKQEHVNVGGTGIVVQEAIRAGVRRFVFFSTIAVYGCLDGQVVNEESPVHPETFYAQTKMAAERLVLNAKSQGGEPLGTVLRFGAVYGARIKGNYRRLLQALARGRFVPIGDGRNRRTLVYDKDVASAVLLAMQHPSAAGRVFNVSDGEFHTLNEIITAMCTSLRRAPPRFALPAHPVRLAAGLLEDSARLVGRQSSIGRATVDKYTEDVAVESRRIQVELGFRPRFSLGEGWRETVDEMRLNGEL